MTDPRATGDGGRVDRWRADGGFDADRRADDGSSDAPARRSDEPVPGDSRREAAGDGAELDGEDGDRDEDGEGRPTEEELRRRVEERYDFENFGPREMSEMTVEEWEVAFDPDTWITGDELLARVEAELKTRIAQREVFAVLEYAEVEGERALVAYSDRDYAIVYPDGSVEGVGTVVRDVKPTVALCSMEEYEVEEAPADWHLPPPERVAASDSQLGHWMIQALAGVQLLVGLAALIAWPILGARDNLVLLAAGLGFVFIGIVLFVMVANARLAERFRLEEYRDRLRTIGTASEERPGFLPIEDEAFEALEGATGREDGE